MALQEINYNKKGISLPVNSVIIIALAIFVLLMLAMFFGNSSDQLNTTELQTAFQEGCTQIYSNDCDPESATTIQTSYLENNEAKNFLYVCQLYHTNPSMTAQQCVWACPSCEKRVYEGMECKIPEDCVSSLTPDWDCCLGELNEDRKCMINSDAKTGQCYEPTYDVSATAT